MVNQHLAKEVALLNPYQPIERHDASSGARVMRIHYFADPDKRGQWAKDFRASTPIPDIEWNREMEGDISVVSGFPVLPEYIDNVNCPEPARSSHISPHPDAILIGGWDCSTSTINLAFVLVQIEPTYGQIQGIIEVIGAPGEAMVTFAPRVAATIGPIVKGAQVIHVGDPAGSARQGATGTTAFQEAYAAAGIRIAPSTNSWAERQGAMVWALTGRVGEDGAYPQFIISGVGCPTIRDGFNGRYQWREIKVGDSKLLREPLKNAYSHPHDALQYAIMQARKLINAVPKRTYTSKLAQRPVIRVG